MTDWPLDFFCVDFSLLNLCFLCLIAVLNFLCSKNQSAAIPDPANCAKYYDCSKLFTSTTLQDMTTECKYPDLFSVKDGKCQDFKSVNCTTRKEPMAPCMLFFSVFSLEITKQMVESSNSL